MESIYPFLNAIMPSYIKGDDRALKVVLHHSKLGQAVPRHDAAGCRPQVDIGGVSGHCLVFAHHRKVLKAAAVHPDVHRHPVRLLSHPVEKAQLAGLDLILLSV